MARTFLLCLFLLALLPSCALQTGALTSERVQDIAWQAIDPNTFSHNRAYWEFVEVKQVKGCF